jgi:formylglycine-generating enzyme required for sulfatase activity
VQGTPGEDNYSYSYSFTYTVNPRGLTSYRLPTEAEWEWAARGGSSAPRYAADIEAIAWFNVNSEVRTHPVGLKLANDYGLYDMLGNVWEWVEDWHGAYVITGAGTVLLGPRGPNAGTFRVSRGGSYWSYDIGVTADYRQPKDPCYGLNNQGFRPARSLSH